MKNNTNKLSNKILEKISITFLI